MDDAVSRSVRTNIENGNYFRDALEWYNDMYLGQLNERFLVLCLSLSISVGTTIMMTGINDLFPVVVRRIIRVSSKDVNNFAKKLRKVSALVESPYETISRKIVSAYVQNRESFDYDNLVAQLKNVHSASTQYVYDQYRKSIAPSNADSILALYGRNYIRTVQIRNVEFIYGDEESRGKYSMPEVALVDFVTTTRSKYSADVTTTNNRAKVEFYISNFLDNNANKNSIKFFVRGYNVISLQDTVSQ
jgi:type IV secretory pathway component VirB8